MKYRRNIGLGEALASQMVDFLRSLQWDIDVMIPVPLGQNYYLGLAYLPQAVWKSRDTRSQVGLNVSQRRENVYNVYQAETEIVKRKSILLMDDVATTGSTISSCTEALISAGARDVYAITIARALAHHSLNRV